MWILFSWCLWKMNSHVHVMASLVSYLGQLKLETAQVCIGFISSKTSFYLFCRWGLERMVWRRFWGWALSLTMKKKTWKAWNPNSSHLLRRESSLPTKVSWLYYLWLEWYVLTPWENQQSFAFVNFTSVVVFVAASGSGFALLVGFYKAKIPSIIPSEHVKGGIAVNFMQLGGDDLFILHNYWLLMPLAWTNFICRLSPVLGLQIMLKMLGCWLGPITYWNKNLWDE